MDLKGLFNSYGWQTVALYFSGKLIWVLWQKYVKDTPEAELKELKTKFEAHVLACLMFERELAVLQTDFKNIKDEIRKNHESANKKLDDIWRVVEKIQDWLIKGSK